MFQMITVKYHKVDALLCKMSCCVKNWAQMQDSYTHKSPIPDTIFGPISQFIFTHYLAISYSYEVVDPQGNLNTFLAKTILCKAIDSEMFVNVSIIEQSHRTNAHLPQKSIQKKKTLFYDVFIASIILILTLINIIINLYIWRKDASNTDSCLARWANNEYRTPNSFMKKIATNDGATHLFLYT